jgi:hypothetical protein
MDMCACVRAVENATMEKAVVWILMVIKRDGWNETLVCIFAAFIDTSGYSDSPAPSGAFAYADHIRGSQEKGVPPCHLRPFVFGEKGSTLI